MLKPLIAIAAVGAIAGVAFFATAAPTNPAAQPNHADARHPVVLELFQSQGCSSCPPANLVLNDIANRPDVLALNFAVTYWDQLGWKDIYGQQKFTERQWDYSKTQGRHNVQTPQLIVNGRAAVLGSFKPEVERAIAANTRGTSGPAISADGTRITIGKDAPAKNATVWLVDYDPRTVQVPIGAGENSGRTLPHRNIVKRLSPIGNWTGGAASYARLAPVSGAQAVIVQRGTGGPIVAAAKL
jgi:hypothetical protein